MKRLRLRPAYAGLTLVWLLAPACRPEAIPPPAPTPPAVTVALPIQREIVEWDEYTGRTEAVASVEVRARVGGYLEAVHFEDGTLVNKGDLLFTIDPRPYQAVLDHAEAELELARTELERATSEWERVQKIGTQGAVSVEEVDLRRTKRAMAVAAVRAAEAAVASSSLDVEYTRITSPIDGRIGRKLLSEGNVVNAGPMNGTLLTTIVSVDPMYCYIDADEQAVLKYIHLARTGERTSAREHEIPAKFALSDEQEFTHEAVVDFVDNRIDPTTGTLRARIVFGNPDGSLVPGLFVRVRIPGSGKYPALLIDDQAIGADLNQRFVLVVDEQGIVGYRPVVLGPIVDGLRVVREGLDPSARVIVNGLMRARPGTPVQPELAAMDPRERAQQAETSAPAPGVPAESRGADEHGTDEQGTDENGADENGADERGAGEHGAGGTGSVRPGEKQ